MRLAAGCFDGEIQPAEHAVKRIGKLAKGSVLEILRLPFAKTQQSGLRNVFLALEIVKKAAFRHARSGTNILHGGGIEALTAHQLDSGIHKLAFRLRQFRALISCHHTDWLVCSHKKHNLSNGYFLSPHFCAVSDFVAASIFSRSGFRERPEASAF